MVTRPAGRWPRASLALTLLTGLLGAPQAFAQSPPLAPDGATAPPPAFADGRRLLFPTGDVYATYIADPHRVTSALTFQFHSHSDIEGTNGTRFWGAGGGYFGLVRLSSGDSRRWQISLDAGFDGMFDSKSKLDNVGWDGNYGLTVTTASEGPLALKFALEHTSGHVGDEWQESTGRERIGYTRHEIAVGAARRVRRMRVYGELGYAFHMLNDELQRPWRVQTGLEREWPQSWADKRLGWYAAADFQLFEERSWRVDYALEGGVLAYSGGRRYRIGARWVDGRPPISEFFQDTERWLTLGFWVDF